MIRHYRQVLSFGCVCVLILCCVGVSAAEPAQVQEGTPATKVEAVRTDVPEFFFFPHLPEYDPCPEQIRDWMKEVVGSVKVSCSPIPIFAGGGFTNYSTPLMDGGVGIFPYIAAYPTGKPDLRIAITLPENNPENVAEILITLDEKEITVPVLPETRRIVVQGLGAVTMMSFDISSDVLPQESLLEITKAKSRRVGSAGARSVKISKANLRTIDQMLRLYKAMWKGD